MSFSSEVKAELAKHLGKSRHCQIAELAALIAFEGRIPAAESENRLLMQKYQLLLAELFHIEEIHTEEEARSVFSTSPPEAFSGKAAHRVSMPTAAQRFTAPRS